MTSKSIHDLKTVLLDYFPGFTDRLSALFEDENFRELAEDFLLCNHEIKQIGILKNKKMIKQYRETLQDLEEELLSYLNPEK